MKKLSLILSLLFIIAGCTTFANAADLFWDANSESDLRGYIVYSQEEGSDVIHSDGPVGVMTEPTFPLDPECYIPGKKYSFWVTAFNDSNESGSSNIVEYTFPIWTPNIDPRPYIINIPSEVNTVTINVN